MTDCLKLTDGVSVELGCRTSGGSKNHTRFGTLPDGQQVVVKIQATHGSLPNEEAALRHAASHHLRAPRIVASGRTDEGVYFLVLSREPGRRTESPDGWYRMGYDYAQLATTPTVDCPLPVATLDEFVDDHRQRLKAVAPMIGSRPQTKIAEAIGYFRHHFRRSLTHGDPGSGNYLDHESGGTILDWETASITAFGIDAGRAAFIALLDNSHTGIPHQLHQAFIDGYRNRLAHTSFCLDDDTLHAGTLIAALQFIHGRHTQPLRSDRTAQMAIDAMTEYLAAR